MPAPSAFDVLSEREREVAALLAVGLSISRVAAELQITEKTVYAHHTSLRLKLGVETAAALTLLAVREGVISMHDEVR